MHNNSDYNASLISDIYSDALPSIEALLQKLDRFPETNRTDEGRTKLELLFLRQEINKGTLQVPQEKVDGMATFRRTVMLDSSLDWLDSVEVPRHAEIVYETLYKGRPKIKPKYFPNVISFINHVIYLFQKQPIIADSEEEYYLQELASVRDKLIVGNFVLPVSPDSLPVTARAITVRDGVNGEAYRLGQERDPGLERASLDLRTVLFRGFCPVENPDFEAK